MAVQTPPELPPEREPRHDYKDAKATVYPTPTTHPKGSQPGEYNAADVLLWLFCWPWALMRWIGRHHDWNRTKQNALGVAATFAVFAVFIAISIASMPTVEPVAQTPGSISQSDSEEAVEEAPEPTATPKPKPQMTSGQENALESAKDYLEYSGFSKKGLIQQLSSSAGEGYSRSDATYAANHAGADWNQEAVESAQSYLDMDSFSRSGLIEQLSSSAGEKFTPAQARYAVNKVYS